MFRQNCGRLTGFSMIRIAILLALFFPTGLFAQEMPCPFPAKPFQSSSFSSGLRTPSIPRATASFSDTCFRVGNRAADRITSDFRNLYSFDSAKNFGVVLLGAGVLANTQMDQNFQNWYGKHVRSSFTDDMSIVAKQFGEGQYFIPIMATSAITYRFFQQRRGLQEHPLGEFTARTTRGYLVGAPALLAFQSLLGAGRPAFDEQHPSCGTNVHHASRWEPFRFANGVSGHAFIGAVPFITAAQMTDKPVVKGLFYALSTTTAWSRVNDDAHYLSQVILGWYLAYLSVRSVSQTESSSRLPRGLTIFPVAFESSAGLGVHYRF